MCEFLFILSKQDFVCIVLPIAILSLIICLLIHLFRKGKNEDSKKKAKCKFFRDFIKEYLIYIFSLLVSLVILSFLIWINSNFLNIIPDEKIEEALGLIISATITVGGVFAGFVFNKKQTYIEVVTKGRKIWLNNLKDNLSEFMAICDVGLVHSWGKDSYEKKERAIELYYNIITNLNIKDEKDRKKILALYNYAINKKLDVVLNFKLDTDDNKDEVEGKNETEKIVDLKLGTREEVMKQFMDLFKDEWEVVKREAE